MFATTYPLVTLSPRPFSENIEPSGQSSPEEDLGHPRMLSIVATCRQQNRNVLELLTACCRARLDGSAARSLLPAQAELGAA